MRQPRQPRKPRQPRRAPRGTQRAKVDQAAISDDRARPSLYRPEFLSEMQFAKYSGLDPAAICKLRLRRQGPTAINFGSMVLYRRADVDGWINSRPEIGGTPEGN